MRIPPDAIAWVADKGFVADTEEIESAQKRDVLVRYVLSDRKIHAQGGSDVESLVLALVRLEVAYEDLSQRLTNIAGAFTSEPQAPRPWLVKDSFDKWRESLPD